MGGRGLHGVLIDKRDLSVYSKRMIEASGPGAKAALREKRPQRSPPYMAEKIETILTILDAASGPESLDLPGLRLHQLKGDLRGSGALTSARTGGLSSGSNGATRIDVELIDYH